MDTTRFTAANIKTMLAFGIDKPELIEEAQLINLVDSWIEQTRTDTILTGSTKASTIFSLRAIAKRLTLEDVQMHDTTPSTSSHWRCTKCDSKITTHIPISGAWCIKHAGQPTPMKAI